MVSGGVGRRGRMGGEERRGKGKQGVEGGWARIEEEWW